MLRYNEDYHYLLKDTARQTNYDRFKLKRLGDQQFLSLGGEARYLMQNFINEDWGDIPVREYTAFYSRFLFHADLHLHKSIRSFVQFNSTFANGRVTPLRSIDENRFAVHQAFVDIRLSKSLLFRAGRQELLYGSQRIISVREGPNNRLSFDAAKLGIQQHNFTLDFLYARPVDIRANVLDDRFNRTQQLWGVYAVIYQVRVLKNADFYYLGYQRENARFDAGVGHELRHSFGTRWWNKTPTWEYDFEALYQTGTFGTGTIHAWTASINTTYRFAEMKRPLVLGMKTEIISGDRNRNDNRLNTFNPLFPRGAYFGLAALIGPSNLMDVHPSAKLEINEVLTLSLDYDLFWRHTLNDGIYGPNGMLIYSGENATARYIGDQVGINFEYSPNRHLSIVPEFTWFRAGRYLKEAGGGKDVFFTALAIQFKY